jgi:hypothetical protein
MSFQKYFTRPIKGFALFFAGSLVAIPVMVLAGAGNFPLSGTVSASALSNYFGGLDDRLIGVESWKSSWRAGGDSIVTMNGGASSTPGVIATLSPGAAGFWPVNCPAGYKVVGGGCTGGSDHNSPNMATVVTSVPNGPGGWVCLFRNDTSQTTVALGVTAVCVKNSP